MGGGGQQPVNINAGRGKERLGLIKRKGRTKNQHSVLAIHTTGNVPNPLGNADGGEERKKGSAHKRTTNRRRKKKVDETGSLTRRFL